MSFFFFAVCVNWILINVLLTIIIEGYERVKQELEGKKNDLEVIEYIKDAAKSMAGIQPRPHFLAEFAPEGSQHDKLVVEKDVEDEKEDPDTDISVVNDLPNKVDQFLEYVNKIYLGGELELKSKGDFKNLMKKPISTDNPAKPALHESNVNPQWSPELPIKSPDLSYCPPDDIGEKEDEKMEDEQISEDNAESESEDGQLNKDNAEVEDVFDITGENFQNLEQANLEFVDEEMSETSECHLTTDDDFEHLCTMEEELMNMEMEVELQRMSENKNNDIPDTT